ncbi:MAG: STAS domain-containing protein [Prolixibacteraceae bacterium]|nr:STAS domain-containing protein [Prolixibacteraceae bacterium]
MNNLEIVHQLNGNELIFTCKGRLDANQSVHLNDYVDRMVREGHYHIVLDMSGIEYISSAGIRSLVTQYKNLKTVNGYFYIAAMSENVNQVLSMVGMLDMLAQPPAKKDASEEVPAKPEHITVGNTHFSLIPVDKPGETDLYLYGNPKLIKESAYKNSDARKLDSGADKFAVGLGAIGDSFDECKSRFGEYIMFGKNIAYLPADGSGKPDYMVSSGKLVASLVELYGVHFEGNFSHLVRFDPQKSGATIGLSQLISAINELTGLKKFAVVMLAESGGLIGTSLNASPVDGKKIFSFPEVKNTVNFTTEPAHNRMLTLSVGYFTSEPGKEDSAFVKNIQPGTPFFGHIHSAVFPYTPLKKTAIDLDETIGFLFNSSELNDILHLTNDTRDIVGLGESHFVQGFCWVAPVESTKTVTTQ